MLIKTNENVTNFQTDQDGINKLKNDFFSEAKDFVYFRKGEWTGFKESLEFAVKFIAEHPYWIPVAYAGYKLSKETFSDLIEVTGLSKSKISKFFKEKPENDNNYVNVRVICGEQDDIEIKIKRWEENVCPESIAVIPKIQTGPFRYIVNDQRYSIISRLGPQTLQGIIGYDQKTINMLRDTFNIEFIKAFQSRYYKPIHKKDV
jgi:hypothetical protein